RIGRRRGRAVSRARRGGRPDPLARPADRDARGALLQAHGGGPGLLLVRRAGGGSVNPSARTVYRWELRKLRFQKRTYLGLGAAFAVPIIFVVATSLRGGHPEDVAFGRYIHTTGLAI